MPISPWYINMTGQSFTIYCRTDSGQAMPLYNSDGSAMNASQFALIIKPPAGPEFTGGGLFAVIDTDNGIIRYQPAASDVQYIRDLQIYVQITTTNGPIYSDEDTWSIEAR